jgi:hypothetical protein
LDLELVVIYNWVQVLGPFIRTFHTSFFDVVPVAWAVFAAVLAVINSTMVVEHRNFIVFTILAFHTSMSPTLLTRWSLVIGGVNGEVQEQLLRTVVWSLVVCVTV